MSMSSLNFCSIPFFCIFTATVFPSENFALCTCATDAVPNGYLSIFANTLVSGCFSSSSIIFFISLNITGIVSSRRCLNSSQYSFGIKSGLRLSTCPNFMYAPPRFSITFLILCGNSSGSFGLHSLNLLISGNCHFSPYISTKYPNPCLAHSFTTFDALLMSSSFVGIFEFVGLLSSH